MRLFKRKDVWWADFVAEGKRQRVTLKTNDKEEAEKRAAKLYSDTLNGVATSPSNSEPTSPSLAECYQFTFDHRWARQRTWKQTLHKKDLMCSLLGEDTPIHAIGFKELSALRMELSSSGLSPSTVNRYMANISAVLSDAEMCGHISRKPRIPLVSEKGRERVRVLSREEEEMFIRECSGHPLAHIIPFLCDTGMRVGEMLAITPNDVKDGAVMVRAEVAKSSKARLVPLTGRALDILQQREDGGSTPFFPYYRSTPSHWFRDMKERLGLLHDTGLVPHACRHTCATRLLEAGVDMLLVKEILGHHSVTMTQRYVHLVTKNLRSAIGKLEAHGQ